MFKLYVTHCPSSSFGVPFSHNMAQLRKHSVSVPTTHPLGTGDPALSFCPSGLRPMDGPSICTAPVGLVPAAQRLSEGTAGEHGTSKVLPSYIPRIYDLTTLPEAGMCDFRVLSAHYLTENQRLAHQRGNTRACVSTHSHTHAHTPNFTHQGL